MIESIPNNLIESITFTRPAPNVISITSKLNKTSLDYYAKYIAEVRNRNHGRFYSPNYNLTIVKFQFGPSEHLLQDMIGHPAFKFPVASTYVDTFYL